MKYYLLCALFLLVGCENVEKSVNAVQTIKTIEPLLEAKCGSKAVVNAFALDGKLTEVGVFFLNKKFENNNDNLLCSKSNIRDEFGSFFQKEYGYDNVDLYMIYDNEKIKL